MRTILKTPAEWAKGSESISHEDHNRQHHRMPGKGNAIVNTSSSSQACEANGTMAMVDDAETSVTAGSPVKGKSDDDDGDGDGDPDSDPQKRRRFVSSTSPLAVPIQRAKSRRILRMPATVVKVGLSRSSIYEKIKKNEFVPQVRLGARAMGFFESDIDEWLEERRVSSTEVV